MRDDRIQAEQHADPDDPHSDEHDVADPDGPDCAGPSRPTMRISTSPIAIQPSSARITGPASLSIGPTSVVRPDHS